MLLSYIKFAVVATFPVIAAFVLDLINKKTAFSKLNNAVKQIIYGLIFGLLAVLGTEWGIPLEIAQVNCRDAAVLTAGLLFGGPAGIIAGLIGGIERWIAVAWGISALSRVACTTSTILAGFFAAAVRKFMLNNKKPTWVISLAVGAIMEIFHMTMVFVTNINDATVAIPIIRISIIPMVIANSLSVTFATLISGGKISRKKQNIKISETIQRWLLVCVFVAFLFSTIFMYGLQNGLSVSQATDTLSLSLDNISEDIDESSDKEVLSVARQAVNDIPSGTLADVAAKYKVSIISIVGNDGIITQSSDSALTGYDVKTDINFNELINGKNEAVKSFNAENDTALKNIKTAVIKTDSGFILVGYNQNDFQNSIGSKLSRVVSKHSVGKNGFVIVKSSDNRVLNQENISDENSAVADELNIDFEADEAKTLLEKKIGNIPYYCMYDVTDGLTVVVLMTENEAFMVQSISLYANTFMEILVFAMMFGAIYKLIKTVIVNKMNKINSCLEEITDGNMDIVVDVRSNEEFQLLSDDINSTVGTLKRYIKEASERIDKELEFAKNIQISSLPNSISVSGRNEFEICPFMKTAKEVGGDFYDFYFTNSNVLNFLIADVSGKGIPAAMFMMRAKTELKNLTESGAAVDSVFTRANNELCSGNEAGMFVTAWQGCLDLETGKVTFANAGHNPPVVRHNGKFDYVKSKHGLVLAGMEGLKYKACELTLEPGDVIFLYTDGVTEATDNNDELYGEDRLLSILNSNECEDMNELCRSVEADIDKFIDGADQFDDITMIALKYFGKKSNVELHFDNAKLENLNEITDAVQTELERINCPMSIVSKLSIAIDEIYSNISKFSYTDGNGPVTVTLDEEFEPHRVVLKFVDKGRPFNPIANELPDVSLGAEEREIGGLGIFMVRKMMDDIRYVYADDSNILELVKNLE